MKILTEIWKPVKEFEGLYEVSNLGNVRSLNYHNWGVIHNLTPVESKDGYLRVCLSKDAKQFNKSVHQMVAQAFLDNPNEFSQVNHINEKKTDNRVENLEWCDCMYNNNYGTRNKRISKSKRNTKCKAVIQLDLQGNFIREWVSLNEIMRVLGFNAAFVARCCHGVKPTAYGYKWVYTT